MPSLPFTARPLVFDHKIKFLFFCPTPQTQQPQAGQKVPLPLVRLELRAHPKPNSLKRVKKYVHSVPLPLAANSIYKIAVKHSQI